MATDKPVELRIVRTFDAPRELVWKAWTDEYHGRQWGPKGFTFTEHFMDLRPGGEWYAVMESTDGRRLRQHGIVQEVVPPARLAFTFIWDEDPDEPMLVEVDLVERGARTEMRFRQSGFTSTESRDGHNEGWSEAFDALERVVAGLV